MIDLPLREISISDFRKLAGNRVLPLDAPIVLLHGPNGTGKTSVLSALELALTGEIRSMRRHDQRYTAHLPFQGQEFATVRVKVSDALSARTQPDVMTVGGSRIDGAPAFDSEASRFYAERSYLDQVSLGQLLDLYTYKEGNEESALALFVNELLGLEQLDALRSGLADSTNLARLKKLSEPLADAAAQAKQAETDLSEAIKSMESARAELAGYRAQLTREMSTLGHEPRASDPVNFAREAADLLHTTEPGPELTAVREISTSLTGLGGRIDGLSARPSITRLDEARSVAVQVAEDYEHWRAANELSIVQWRTDVAGLELLDSGDDAIALDEEIRRIDTRFMRDQNVAAGAAEVEARLADHRATLARLEAEIGSAQEQAGSLAAALASLREHVSENECPVCNRDFSEVSSTHLTAHLDHKIDELTDQGRRIHTLGQERDSIRTAMHRDEQKVAEQRGQLLTPTQADAAASRRAIVVGLRARLEDLQPTIDAGLEHRANVRNADAELVELEAAADEEQLVRSRLDSLARELGAPASDPTESLRDCWQRLSDVAATRISLAEERDVAHTEAHRYVDQMLRCQATVEDLRNAVEKAAQRKLSWSERVVECKRRQAVARAVHTAASDTRSAIVQRVFTESLNDVWGNVFSRLAPNEGFTPSFGIPSSSKTALELKIETIHSSGEVGGSPQMMLSAGNLNTAALSLFVALHLAVDPLVPCLVFDDPVQSMDEVHVAQFAGLMRVLSKRHERQIVIAVHERALFEYLSFELSPAFEGDELITIELGARSGDEDGGVTRMTWSPDRAIAV